MMPWPADFIGLLQKIHFSVYLSFRSVLVSSQFLLQIFLLSPQNKTWAQAFIYLYFRFSRVPRGDVKRTQCLGDINTGTWNSRLGESPDETVLRNSNHWVIALQTADPSSRHRNTETKPQHSDSNLPTGSNIWSQVPEWARHLDILTDWPSVVMWFDFDMELFSDRR
jgi:hypothetical protein